MVLSADPGRAWQDQSTQRRHLAEFRNCKDLADSKSWTIDAKGIDQTTFDLSVKNPNGVEEVKHRSPKKIMDEIAALDAESARVLEKIRRFLRVAEGG